MNDDLKKAAYAEEKAEVEVLFAALSKFNDINKRLAASRNRVEESGRIIDESIRPIYGNTQKLQIMNTNIDAILGSINNIQKPLDQKNHEEQIIRMGPKKAGMKDFIASMDRTTRAVANLKSSNLRSNQQGITELNSLLKLAMRQMEDMFREILREDVNIIEPLHFITKNKPFPKVPEEKAARLNTIHKSVIAAVRETSQTLVRDTPTGRVYADIRGDYVTASLKNLAAASLSMARKTTPNAVYRQGTNGIGTYAAGIEGIFYAEYDSVVEVFAREDVGMMFITTCQPALKDFSRTIKDLNTHIQNNLLTDCFLGYEIIDIVTQLSFRLEGRTGELRRDMMSAVEPIRSTSKSSFSKLLEDTRNKVQSMISLPIDAGAVPITSETMARLQTMSSYLKPVSSILTSLGDGGWNNPSASMNNSNFDVGADGQELFNHFAQDMIDALISSLQIKSSQLIKGRGGQGVFMHNNVAIVNRMIRNSELVNLLNNATSSKVESLRKRATASYLDAWKEPSAQLLDVQYTNRGGRPTSGGTAGMDSAAVVKNLSSKDRDAIKEKFKNFNASFDELIQKHRGYKMERETRQALSREVQVMIEPLYSRFWDRYHEIDKGKGKYVKYDKQQLSSALANLG